MKFFAALLGLMMIFEGLPYALFPEAMQNWLRHLLAARPALLRAVGIVAVLFGFLFCYIAQRTGWLD